MRLAPFFLSLIALQRCVCPCVRESRALCGSRLSGVCFVVFAGFIGRA